MYKFIAQILKAADAQQAEDLWCGISVIIYDSSYCFSCNYLRSSFFIFCIVVDRFIKVFVFQGQTKAMSRHPHRAHESKICDIFLSSFPLNRTKFLLLASFKIFTKIFNFFNVCG